MFCMGEKLFSHCAIWSLSGVEWERLGSWNNLCYSLETMKYLFCDLVLVSNDVCVTLTSKHCGESTVIAICIVLQLKCHRPFPWGMEWAGSWVGYRCKSHFFTPLWGEMGCAVEKDWGMLARLIIPAKENELSWPWSPSLGRLAGDEQHWDWLHEDLLMWQMPWVF